MLRKLALAAFITFGSMRTVGAQDAEPVILEVRVEGIKNLDGEIGVALYKSNMGYPTHLEYAYEAEWVAIQQGQTAVGVTFDTIPPGLFYPATNELVL